MPDTTHLDLTPDEQAWVAAARHRPCRKGHSRRDAFVRRRQNGKLALNCRRCTNDRVRRQRLVLSAPYESLVRLLARIEQRPGARLVKRQNLTTAPAPGTPYRGAEHR